MSDAYLDESVIGRIRNKQFSVPAVRGRLAGLHSSRQRGFNAEFSQHRRYDRGDELRRIDWRLYARSDKLYIKEYENDTNMQVVFCLDRSRSLLYEEGLGGQKAFLQKRIVSHLAYLILNQQDTVSVRTGLDGLGKDFLTMRSRRDLGSCFKYLDNIQYESEFVPDKVMRDLYESCGRRSLVFLISDFWFDPVLLEDTLQPMASEMQICFLHMIDPAERTLSGKGNVRMVDMETDEAMSFNVRSIQKKYQEALQMHCKRIRTMCEKNRIYYIQIDTGSRLENSIDGIIDRIRKSP